MKIENIKYKGVTLNFLTTPKVKPETLLIMEQRVLQMSPQEYFYSRSAMERDYKFLVGVQQAILSYSQQPHDVGYTVGGLYELAEIVEGMLDVIHKELSGGGCL